MGSGRGHIGGVMRFAMSCVALVAVVATMLRPRCSRLTAVGDVIASAGCPAHSWVARRRRPSRSRIRAACPRACSTSRVPAQLRDSDAAATPRWSTLAGKASCPIGIRFEPSELGGSQRTLVISASQVARSRWCSRPPHSRPIVAIRPGARGPRQGRDRDVRRYGGPDSPTRARTSSR